LRPSMLIDSIKGKVKESNYWIVWRKLTLLSSKWCSLWGRILLASQIRP